MSSHFWMAMSPPIGHPPFIQGLIDDHLIEVQVKGTYLRASEFQQESWVEFCKGLGKPSQVDWDAWRYGFIIQQEEEFDQLMTPGIGFGQFTKVWIREISLQATQPSSL